MPPATVGTVVGDLSNRGILLVAKVSAAESQVSEIGLRLLYNSFLQQQKLSPANDFHGRVGDLRDAVGEISSAQWRVTCSPHHNHQDTPEYEVATLLWFDWHLKKSFSMPNTPATTLKLRTDAGVPTFTVRPDRSRPVVSVDCVVESSLSGASLIVRPEVSIASVWFLLTLRRDPAPNWKKKSPMTTINALVNSAFRRLHNQLRVPSMTP